MATIDLSAPPIGGVSSVDGSNNVVLTNGLTLAAAGVVQWGATTKVSAPADAILQVTKSDGTFATILLGANASTTGVRLVSSSNATLTLMGGDGTSSLGTLKLGSSLIAGGSGQFNTNDSAGAGLGVGSNANGIFFAKLSAALAYQVQDTSSGTHPAFLQIGQLTVAKTQAASPYTVTFADMGTLFTNAGATGAVTFNLPTAQQGLWYRFAVIANQTITVTAGAGTVTAVGLTSGASRSMATQYGSFDVVCYDGTNWVCRAVNGTLT